MRSSSSLRGKLALLLVLAVSAARIGLGFSLNPEPERVGPAQQTPSKMFLSMLQTIADFDGDRLPDQAELISHGFHKDILLSLSSPQMKSLDFSAETQQAGRLLAGDIDQDSDNDLVWVSDQQMTYTALWLNNGIGEFTFINNPAAYTAEIQRLVVRERNTNLLTSLAGSWLSVISTSPSTVLARPKDQLPEIASFIFVLDSLRRCAVRLSSCVSHYPKRGPPLFLSSI